MARMAMSKGGGGGSAVSELLALTQYNPGTLATLTTTSTTFVDLDATNLAVAFVVPASGTVLVRLTGESNGSGGEYWNLREGAANVASSYGYLMGGASTIRQSFAVRLSGLTPGASVTYKWGWRVASGTGSFYAGGANDGPAVMEVWAA